LAAKKKSSGVMVHVVITMIGIAGAFFAGWKTAGSGQGEIATQISEMKGSIDANGKLIGANKKLTGTNKMGLDATSRTVSRLSSTVSGVSRSVSATKAGLASAGVGMAYVNKVLGLEEFTRFSDGHRYYLTPYPLPWKYAQDFAKKVGGSLVVINDKAENEWIAKTFGTSTEFWIGLSDERDEGKWLWVNDLDAVYKNWATGEPDNYRKMQHHVIMNKQAAKGATQAGKWNDIPGNEIKIGIIEIGR
jgi:hypothetical protein